MATAMVRQIVLAYAKDRTDGIGLQVTSSRQLEDEPGSQLDSFQMRKIAPDLYMHVLEMPEAYSYQFSLCKVLQKKLSAPSGEGVAEAVKSGAPGVDGGADESDELSGELLMRLATANLCSKHFHDSTQELHLTEADYRSILESGRCACPIDEEARNTASPPESSTLADPTLEREKASEHVSNDISGETNSRSKKGNSWTFVTSDFKLASHPLTATNQRDETIEGVVSHVTPEHHVTAQSGADVLFTSWGSSKLYSLDTGGECRKELYEMWQSSAFDPKSAENQFKSSDQISESQIRQMESDLQEELSDGELEAASTGKRLLRLLAGARFKLMEARAWMSSKPHPQQADDLLNTADKEASQSEEEPQTGERDVEGEEAEENQETREEEQQKEVEQREEGSDIVGVERVEEAEEASDSEITELKRTEGNLSWGNESEHFDMVTSTTSQESRQNPVEKDSVDVVKGADAGFTGLTQVRFNDEKQYIESADLGSADATLNDTARDNAEISDLRVARPKDSTASSQSTTSTLHDATGGAESLDPPDYAAVATAGHLTPGVMSLEALRSSRGSSVSGSLPPPPTDFMVMSSDIVNDDAGSERSGGQESQQEMNPVQDDVSYSKITKPSLILIKSTDAITNKQTSGGARGPRAHNMVRVAARGGAQASEATARPPPDGYPLHRPSNEPNTSAPSVLRTSNTSAQRYLEDEGERDPNEDQTRDGQLEGAVAGEEEGAETEGEAGRRRKKPLWRRARKAIGRAFRNFRGFVGRITRKRRTSAATAEATEQEPAAAATEPVAGAAEAAAAPAESTAEVPVAPPAVEQQPAVSVASRPGIFVPTAIAASAATEPSIPAVEADVEPTVVNAVQQPVLATT